MGVSQDFEARRRERIMQNRKKKQRLKRIRLIILGIIAVLVVIAIISNISRCASEKNQSVSNNSAVTTQIPFETATPAPTATSSVQSKIPAPVKGENNFLDEITRSGQKKHVYLTFDDGPNDVITPQILDVLRRYNVKATFFMVGKYIEAKPYMCTRVIEEGHLAAPHAYTHDYATIYANESSFRDEVEKTYKLIVDNTPGNVEPFKIFRFPGGGFNDSNYGSQKQGYKDALADMGFYHCDWNSLNGDAEGSKKDANAMIDYFKKTRPNVNNLVILMHDAADKQATADALPKLIELLMSEGYTFSRLDEIDYSNESQAAEKTSEKPNDSIDETDTSDTSEKSSSSSSSSTTSKPTETKKPVASSTKKPSNSSSSSDSKKTSAPSTPAVKSTQKAETEKKDNVIEPE